MQGTDEIVFERQGGLGLVTLNRPAALNALSLDMIRRLSGCLGQWAGDPRVGVVAIRGAGGRAFCAGGDVRDLYERRGSDFGPIYYEAEYRLDIAIARFPKPYISLMDGLTMGGGAGVALHGSHRLAGERTVFAMPEVAIGLFPDAGASLFLNHCPGEIGTYLALTGARLKAADAIYAGIADAFVPTDDLDRLVEALAGLVRPDRQAVDALVAGFAADPGPAPLKAHRAAIDRCFSANNVEEVLARLAAEESAWAAAQAETIARMSPTSLKVALRQLRQARSLTRIEDVMASEYRLAHNFYLGHDFFEGTRALVIDKDGTPKWRPASLAEVGAADVEAWFAAVPSAPSFETGGPEGS